MTPTGPPFQLRAQGRPLRLLQDSLERAAQACPGKYAIVAGPTRITYGQLWEVSARLAQALKAHGVSRGARVAIWLENSWQCAAAIYGALLADAAFVLINPQIKQQKLAYILKDSGARVLLAEPALASAARMALQELSSPPILWLADMADAVVERPAALAPSTHSLTAALASAPAGRPETRAISVDLAALIYTSGSTGEAKGVMHTHQSMRFALESLVEYLGLRDDDRILCMLPLAFDYGLYQLLMATEIGATLVLERNFTYPARLFQVMQQEQITVFPGVPTAFALLLSAGEKTQFQFPLVRILTNTAAALPASYNRRLKRIFPAAQLFRMYGQTECKRVCYLPPQMVEEKPDSVGHAIPGTETLLLDEAGRPVPPGQPGTLHVRGAHVMRGYWQQPELSARMLKPGPTPGEKMLCTHDLFTADGDGHLYFVGRTDNIIKCRGEKVSPVEIENVLCSLPGVRDAAVFGHPDPLLGEAVHAAVSLEEGAQLDEMSLRQLCAQRLENHLVPRRIALLPELPRSANGKVDGRAAAALAEMT